MLQNSARRAAQPRLPPLRETSVAENEPLLPGNPHPANGNNHKGSKGRRIKEQEESGPPPTGGAPRALVAPWPRGPPPEPRGHKRRPPARLPRPRSSESLPLARSPRVHSSADELSSLTRSPSLSSSDESYSRTTDASPSPPRARAAPGPAYDYPKRTKPDLYAKPVDKLIEVAADFQEEKLQRSIINMLASAKRDSCSQTDKKDVGRGAPRAGSFSSSGSRAKHERPPATKADVACVPPFEREIQRLLDDKSLIKPCPPKAERKELKLELRAGLGRGSSSSSPLHCVGLAAIAQLARAEPAAHFPGVLPTDVVVQLPDARYSPPSDRKIPLDTGALKEKQEKEIQERLHNRCAGLYTESQSEWSSSCSEGEGEGGAQPESTGYTTDDPALENVSMLNEAGLTDAEAALSDVNSCYFDRDDDVSSRASSRLLDSEALVSLESLSAIYDSDEPAHRYLANIRTVSECITRNFGQPTHVTDGESDV